MKKKTFIILFVLVFSYKLYPCTCRWQGSFFKVAPKTKLVALVKINKYIHFNDGSLFQKKDKSAVPISMEVEIIKVISGNEKRKKVKVWGDIGNL